MIRQMFRNVLGRFARRPSTTPVAVEPVVNPRGLESLAALPPVKKTKVAPKAKTVRRELSLTRKERQAVIATSPLIDAMSRYASGMKIRYDGFRKSATVVAIIGRHKKPLAVLSGPRGRKFRRPVGELQVA